MRSRQDILLGAFCCLALMGFIITTVVAVWLALG